MIYISKDFNLSYYNNYSIYGDKILFIKNNTNYISSQFNTTNYDYAIYFINTDEFIEYKNEQLPFEFISYAHLGNISFYPIIDTNGDIERWTTTGQSNPTYNTIYLNRDFSQFTNNVYYSPKFPQIFICGFLNLLIVLFIINGLSRLIFKGGIFFHK